MALRLCTFRHVQILFKLLNSCFSPLSAPYWNNANSQFEAEFYTQCTSTQGETCLDLWQLQMKAFSGSSSEQCINTSSLAFFHHKHTVVIERAVQTRVQVRRTSTRVG